MDWDSLVERDELLFNGLTLGFQKANKKKYEYEENCWYNINQRSFLKNPAR